jgi:hypothetical protein
MSAVSGGRGRLQELLFDGVLAIGLALSLPIVIVLVALPFVLAVRGLIELAKLL